MPALSLRWSGSSFHTAGSRSKAIRSAEWRASCVSFCRFAIDFAPVHVLRKVLPSGRTLILRSGRLAGTLGMGVALLCFMQSRVCVVVLR
jgi:hypothetical protein